MKLRPIPEKTRQAQIAASDPEVSAWVSANAGAGKTYVLAQRAIRLLLAGVPPSRILCLTFTKAAAAHMANQVLNTLREWTGLDDTALDQRLAALEAGPASPAWRAIARRLFATALETPGGLKVQTIHAFCDRVLHQFPFESRVPAGFIVLEEAGERELLNRVRNDVLREAAEAPASELGCAFATAVAAASDQSLAEVFDEAVRARRNLAHLLEGDGLMRAKDAIATALGLSAEDSLASIEREITEGPHLPKSQWADTCAKLRTMGGNAARRGDCLADAAAAEGGAAVDFYLAVFFNKENGPRADSQFGGAKLRADHSELFERLFKERARLEALSDNRRAAIALERTHALNVIAGAMIGRYEELKRARGALDYDDLITKTVDLLSDQAAAWVHYKLDGGIDHILIDEAQDTSPEQWKIVERLAQEFFAGSGARLERARTIFAVGDEKQSIFAFQGADPAGFHRMHVHFRKRVRGAGRSFHDGRLELSFRSVPGIVAAIDAIFARPEAFRGLSKNPDEKSTLHHAFRGDAPPRVEVWDTIAPAEESEDELAWDAPLDARSETSPPAALAQRIARAVKCWLGGEICVSEPRTGAPRAPNAGDIIILVRQRGALFEEILRALKNAELPVAGADRLQLSEHIAVMDIAALCDALLLEGDDLALACALKSPLFAFDDDDLLRLALGRRGTLADALKRAGEQDERLAAAAHQLTRWRTEARALRPFDFLSRVLGRDGAREKIIARLGTEAADALDELLAQALAYEGTGTPSLQGFLAFLRRSASQVKRDLEVASAAIRVMTVHGAKGLEAPIIMLADTTFMAEGRNDPWLLPLAENGEAPPALVWGLSAKNDSRALAEARARVRRADAEEHRRLLYVALTRARDALIVCGCENARQAKSGLSEETWYRLVRDALREELEEVPNTEYGFGVWRWRSKDARRGPQPAPQTRPQDAAPVWLRAPTTIDWAASRRFTPSALFSARSKAGEARSRGGLDPQRRGILLHRLLQELPRFPADRRKDESMRFLASAASDLPEEARAKLVAESLAVLDRPDFAMLFGPQSRGEVELFGRPFSSTGEDDRIRRIDRLVVTAESILLADYKTDVRFPARPEEAPEDYLAQLALYRALLGQSLPGRAMRAFLVWTAGPAIQEVPNSLLDDVWRRVKSL